MKVKRATMMLPNEQLLLTALALVSRKRSLLVLGIGWVGACTDLTPPAYLAPESGPMVTVTAGTYRWSVDSAIAVSVTNASGAMTFTLCGPFRLQRYRDGWQEVQQPGVGFADPCGSFPIASSDTLRQTIPLTNDYVPTSGWYRVVVNLYHDSNVRLPWAEANCASAPFQVKP